MSTYVVVRSGVYDQGVVGVTSVLTIAKGIAEKAAADEVDTYHDFDIRTQEGFSGEYNKSVMSFTSPDARDYQATKPRVWTDNV